MTEEFREIGYDSAKVQFARSYGRIFGFGSVLVLIYIVYTFINALDQETLRIFAITFIAIALALFALVGALGAVVVFRYIQKPGVQLPGRFGEYERRLGLD